MKNWVARLLILGAISFLITEARAGSWTAHEFIYKPALGAKGATEKNTFDSGLDRMDARLGKQIWVGDPNYGTTFQNAITAIGSNSAILRIPAGTHSIAADLTVPANITLRPERGAVFAIATTITLTINGGLQAGLDQIFSCSGTGKVIFGPGAVKVAYPQWWGAAADWNGATGTDNYAPIQAAVASGVPRVYLSWGPGYGVSQPVCLPDGCHLSGPPGNKVLLVNFSASEPSGWPGAVWYWTNALQVGNYGGWGYGHGVDEETAYNINTITPPANTVTLTTTGEVNNFAVGDIVFLTSYATKAVGGKIKYSQTNKVRAINTGTGVLTLELPILDLYTSSAPNYCKIRRVSGSVTGLDGTAAKVVKDVRISNLTIQSLKTGITWSAMHASAYNFQMDNVDIIGTYAGLGLNPGGRILLNNVTSRIVGGSAPGFAMEITYLTNNVILRNVELVSEVAAAIGLNMGEHGCDVDVDGLIVSGGFANYGVLIDKQRCSFRNLRVINTNGTTGVPFQVSADVEDIYLNSPYLQGGLVGLVISRYNQRIKVDRPVINYCNYGITLGNVGTPANLHDIRIYDYSILNYTVNAIQAGDTMDRVKIKGGTAIRASGTGWAIDLGATAHTDCEVSNNILGVSGARIIQDAVHDGNLPPVVKAENNLCFTSQTITRDYTTATLTGTTDLTTLKSKSFPGATLRRNQGFDFKIAGAVSGVNNAKTFCLMLGGTQIDTFSYLAAETGNYQIEGRVWIENNSYVVHVDYTIRFYNGTSHAFKRVGAYQGTINLSGNFTFNINGQLSNAGDTITVDSFVVEPINDSLSYI
jgi:hypothetical protein